MLKSLDEHKLHLKGMLDTHRELLDRISEGQKLERTLRGEVRKLTEQVIKAEANSLTEFDDTTFDQDDDDAEVETVVTSGPIELQPVKWTKKSLLEHLREEFEDDLEFGGKSWWRNDLAESLEMQPNELFDRDHDTGLLFQLDQDGDVECSWCQRDEGTWDYLITLNGGRVTWDEF